MKNFIYSLVMLLVCCVFFSCKSKKQPPIDLSSSTTKSNVVEVEYQEFGGDKTIPVKLNGVTMDMIFDTGCSGMLMSLAELQVLFKNGKIDESDILGTSVSQIADGSIVKNGVIMLREVEIAKGLTLYNVEASVALNQTAPMLLGNGVLDEFASYEIDNITHTIKFKLK